MPNTFTDNRDRWLLLSEVDYLGQFVKAWLAFNAWYRSAYTETQDRKIINEFKWQSNPVLNKLRPLLNNDITSEEAEQFRSEIGLLHHRLQNYEVHTGKGAEKERITLENIYLRDNAPCAKNEAEQGYGFFVERATNGQMKVEVKNRKGVVVLNHPHARHDFTQIEAQAGFTGLTNNLKGYLRGIYHEDAMKPKLVANLTTGAAAPVKCGSYEFKCTPDFLFAGVVESIYLMRCTLFHGELNPTKDSNACYEPAYYIVRRFLLCIT